MSVLLQVSNMLARRLPRRRIELADVSLKASFVSVNGAFLVAQGSGAENWLHGRSVGLHARN